jgi:hypothetical protein
MARNWYETEQDVRLRHATDRRAAALARRAAADRRMDQPGRGPWPAQRLLARFGGWLVACLSALPER